jgi:hypothetical protein
MNPDDLPDEDPDVVAGMARLAELRVLEHQVIDFPTVRDPT